MNPNHEKYFFDILLTAMSIVCTYIFTFNFRSVSAMQFFHSLPRLLLSFTVNRLSKP